jgi:hypothetical protein
MVTYRQKKLVSIEKALTMEKYRNQLVKAEH